MDDGVDREADEAAASEELERLGRELAAHDLATTRPTHRRSRTPSTMR